MGPVKSWRSRKTLRAEWEPADVQSLIDYRRAGWTNHAIAVALGRTVPAVQAKISEIRASGVLIDYQATGRPVGSVPAARHLSPHESRASKEPETIEQTRSRCAQLQRFWEAKGYVGVKFWPLHTGRDQGGRDIYEVRSNLVGGLPATSRGRR